MRQRHKNRRWWLAVLALGAVAVACSAIDENDKTQNPTLDSGVGATSGDAGVPGTTGGTGATTADAGP